MDSCAVTTIIWMAPGNNRSICKNCSKCTIRALNMLHTPELILHMRTVTSTRRIAPGNNGSICKDCSKCQICCLNMLHTLQLILNMRAVPTRPCFAPGNDPVTTTAPQCKGQTCCSQLGLTGDGRQMVSILKSCSF